MVELLSVLLCVRERRNVYKPICLVNCQNATLPTQELKNCELDHSKSLTAHFSKMISWDWLEMLGIWSHNKELFSIPFLCNKSYILVQTCQRTVGGKNAPAAGDSSYLMGHLLGLLGSLGFYTTLRKRSFLSWMALKSFPELPKLRKIVC